MEFQVFQRAVWTKKENLIAFFDQLGKELNFHQPEDWYNLRKEDVEKHSGHALLKCYGSMSTVWFEKECTNFVQALKQIYPEHTWHCWRFNEQIPIGFW